MRILTSRSARWCLRSTAVILAMVAGVSTAFAAPITTPAELNPGDQYRLVFVTTTTRDATSTDITDYNAFVTGVANTQAALAALGTTWTAIASSSAEAARDNTGTNPLATTGVPIYRLDGVSKVVDDNLDLWNGDLDLAISLAEDGTTAIFNEVWTGTDPAGNAVVGAELGSASPIVGDPAQSDASWINLAALPSFTPFHFYALSDVLTVAPVPEPAILPLLATGLAALGFARRKRNR